MMRLKKLQAVMDLVELAGLTGSMYAMSTGELALSITGQPQLWVHRALTKLGFVEDPDTNDYIYRPRQRKTA